MLRVGIIGCGKIADSHASQIRSLKGCEIVGVCDREELMAKQLADRFSISRLYSRIEDLFEKARPEVVHITTPPQTHFEVAKQCLVNGCHVYVEKPLTLTAEEAVELVRISQQKGRKLTVGHDLQYSHSARRMRRLVREGHLGGYPVHMESYYCYDLRGAGYAKAVLGDKKHWVRQLPGKLLHNVISHGIARIAEYFSSDCPAVWAQGLVSPMLKRMGERELVDELRVTMWEESGTTAYFTFSSQMRPALNQFRIYGSSNGFILDQENETLIQLRGAKYKSYAEHFLSPLVLAKQYVGNTARNACKFLGNDFHMKSGMRCLIEAFYQSIRDDGAPPIPYSEILRTSRILDKIFGQLETRAPRMPAERVLEDQLSPAETGILS